MPRPFTPPRFTAASTALTDQLTQLAERYAAIEADANLSAQGKLSTFSREAAAVYKRLDARRPVLAGKRRDLLEKLDRLGALALKGAQASPDEQQVFLSFVGAARTEKGMREKLVRRLTDEHDVSTETQKLRRFVLSLPDELTNVAHMRDLIGLRLRPTLPTEVAELARAAEVVDLELRQTEQALDAITASADRDVLQEAGAVGPRIVTWSSEERARYVATYGPDALAAAIAREAILGAESSRERTVEAEARQTADVDMSAFFTDATDPALRAADAVLAQ